MRWALALVLLQLPLLSQQVFRTSLDAAVPSLDPIVSNDPRSFRLTAQVFESPLELAMDDKDRCVISPGLASMPEISKDGKTLKFQVVPGSRFSDDSAFPGGKGREVTAKDFVYSLLRVADPMSNSPFYASFLEGRLEGLDAWREQAVKEKRADYDQPPSGIQAEGSTWTLVFNTPYPQFLSLLTQPWASIVPREVVSYYGSGFGDHPVGTGPFLFVAKDALGNVKFVKNPGYRLPGKPSIDELRFDVIPTVDKRTDRLLANELHVCDVVPQNEDRLMDKKGKFRESLKGLGLRFAEGPPLMVSYLAFGMHHQALSKLAVRQAISLAIDRNKLNRSILGERGVLANGPIPPAFPEYDVVNDQPFDLANVDKARAKKLLAEAGYPEGKGFPELIFDLPNASQSQRESEGTKGMIEDLASVGIKVQIRTESLDAFNARVKKNDVQIAWMSWYADYADVENFLLMFRTGPAEDPARNSNYGGYSNPEFDKLYDQIAASFPSPTRTALVKQAVGLLRKDAPWVFLCFIKSAFVVTKPVTGFRYNILNMSLRDVKVAAAKR